MSFAVAKKYRVLPPHDVARQRVTVGGRVVTGAPGSVLDVDRATAAKLEASGWSVIGPVGPTTERPAEAARGDIFLDNTLDAALFWDGSDWRDSAGAVH